MFRSQNTKLNNSFKVKLDGKGLLPTPSVKYLGVLLDEHLTWSPQILYVQMIRIILGTLDNLIWETTQKGDLK